MRRRPGVLLEIEATILATGVEMAAEGEPAFHGFAIARRMRQGSGARRLTAHGTLYKALDRLEIAGLLASSWEDPLVAAEARRPRRRLYTVTEHGVRELERVPAEHRREGSPARSLRAPA